MSIVGAKNRIKTLMEQLVTSEDLAGVTSMSFNHDPFDFETQKYPHAFITPPPVSVEVLDNRTLQYNCQFTIQFLVQGEDIAHDDETNIETLIQIILTKLANDPTLDNNATAGSEIVISANAPTFSQHKKKDFISFDVILEAQVTEDLTFA